MSHRFAQTSVDSYAKMQREGKVSDLQLEIIVALKKFGAMTRKQIAKRIDRELSSICGQVRALLDLGRIKVVGKIFDDRTGRHQEILAIESEQRSFFE